MIKQLLVYPHGVAYIASKRYYFGVGGGTSDFIHIFNNTNGILNDSIRDNYNPVYNIQVMKVIEDKFSNIREILKISYHV